MNTIYKTLKKLYYRYSEWGFAFKRRCLFYCMRHLIYKIRYKNHAFGCKRALNRIKIFKSGSFAIFIMLIK